MALRKRLLLWASGLLVIPAVLLGTLSCSNLSYYANCTKGQFNILSKRQPIDQLVCQSDIEPDLKLQLEKVLRIRDFASSELQLPENGSYRSYVDLQRPYAVWNIVATPEFDLQPLQWCFPIAGCVSYRGFFSEEEASRFAEDLRDRGHDVYLYGVSAYSTLGWFSDPVFNTFLGRSEEDLAGLIFHELAHQKVYVKNDSVFNESFAKAVELEGVIRWLTANGEEQRINSYLEGKKQHEEFIGLVMDFRQELRDLYRSPLENERKREEKRGLFDELRRSYAELKQKWNGGRSYDRWFAELNNAKIASISTYHNYVPAFQSLLRQSGGDMGRFYLEVAALGRLPKDGRLARLHSLQPEKVAAEAENPETIPGS